MHDEENQRLKAVNQHVVQAGCDLPAVRLRSGQVVQTGTVAAMLANIRRYNAGERGEVEAALRLCVPTLMAIGLFELFPPEAWVGHQDEPGRSDNPGRSLVGREAQRLIG